MNTKLPIKLERAVFKIVNNYPHYAFVLLRKEIVYPSDYNETAWTDYKSIGFSEKFVTNENDHGVEFALGHENLHIILQHDLRGVAMQKRYNNFDWKRWNLACDFEINPSLVEEGFKLPISIRVCIDERFYGKCAEEIYRILDKEEKEGKQNNYPDPMGEVCPPNSQKGEGENDNSNSGVTDSELDDLKTEREVETNRAINIAKGQGKLSASFVRVVNTIPPQTDIRDFLLRFLNDRCKNDYSYARPNKRYIQNGIYLPTLYSQTFQRVLLVVDTSGSTANEIKKFGGIVKDCLSFYAENGTPPELQVIYCDTKVQRIDIVDEEYKWDNVPQGGGTDFTDPFIRIAKDDIDCAALVYLTDGYGHCAAPEPEFPVLWALIVPNNSFAPKFGEKMFI